MVVGSSRYLNAMQIENTYGIQVGNGIISFSKSIKYLEHNHYKYGELE